MRITRDAVRTTWRRWEPLVWFVLIAVVVAAQWPVLKGWYYKATGAEAPASAVEWRTDLTTALTEARATRRLVLVHFTAAWCPSCIAMKHDVWPDAGVARGVGEAFVPLLVDTDRSGELASRYDVPAIPALVILDADGRIVRRHDGFLPKSGVLRFLSDRLN